MEEIEEPVVAPPSINELLKQVIPEFGSNPECSYMGCSRWPVVNPELSKKGILQKMELLYMNNGVQRESEFYIDYISRRLIHTGVGSGVTNIAIAELHERVANIFGFSNIIESGPPI